MPRTKRSKPSPAPLLTAWLLLWLGAYPPVLLLLSGVGVVAAAAFMLARAPAR